jgi:hypothetical protein
MPKIGGDGKPIQVLHANCHLTTPVMMGAFETLVESIDSFWLTTVTLPTHAQGH